MCSSRDIFLLGTLNEEEIEEKIVQYDEQLDKMREEFETNKLFTGNAFVTLQTEQSKKHSLFNL